MNIQAWLQLNSKTEFSVCFFPLHQEHDKNKLQVTYPKGRLIVRKRKKGEKKKAQANEQQNNSWSQDKGATLKIN